MTASIATAMMVTMVPAMTTVSAVTAVATSPMATRFLTQGDMDDIQVGLLHHLTPLTLPEVTVVELIGGGGQLQLETLANPSAIVTGGKDPAVTLVGLSKGLASCPEVFLAQEEGYLFELEAGIGSVLPATIGIGDRDLVDRAVCLGTTILICLSQSGEQEDGTDGSVN